MIKVLRFIVRFKTFDVTKYLITTSGNLKLVNSDDGWSKLFTDQQYKSGTLIKLPISFVSYIKCLNHYIMFHS